MKKIELTQGKFALVDDADFDVVNKHRWCASKAKSGKTYYVHRLKYSHLIWTTQTLHRFLLKAKKGQQVDHINGNGLDNRRCNIRLCNNAENHQNIGKRRGVYSSKYKGVTWRDACNKFQVQIQLGKKRLNLGYFKNEVMAALVYDVAALKYHRKFAKLNFPILKKTIQIVRKHEYRRSN